MVAERIGRGDKARADKVFRVALIYTGGISMLSTCVIWVAATQLSLFLKGSEVLTQPLRALAPTLFFISIAAVFRGYFQGMNNMVTSAIS